MHRFRELKVYQRALIFSKSVRVLTKSFPKEEIFILTSQFRRAADSIVLNISEGSGNHSSKEFSKFLTYSIRSAYECIGCIDIALTNEYIITPKHSEFNKELQEIIAMLIGLQKTL